MFKLFGRLTSTFVVILFAASSARAADLDLTTAGASGFINTAFFQQVPSQSTGTGVIDSFVRISPPGNQATEQGYNTDFRPLQFDENSSPTFTKSITLADVPAVTLGGISYRQFLLDINENNNAAGDQFLSLDRLEIFVSSDSMINGYNTGTKTFSSTATETLVYDLDAGADNRISLNYALNTGSGSGDMFAYIPDSLFTAAGATNASYVTLFSRFGDKGTVAGPPQQIFSASDGFEEWSVIKGQNGGQPPGGGIPEPSTIVLLGMGTIAFVVARRRRQK